MIVCRNDFQEIAEKENSHTQNIGFKLFKMNFRTTISTSPQPGYLRHSQPILLLGSCFAENIGRKLQEKKFDIDLNPFGTLYNPYSIADAIDRIAKGQTVTPDELFEQNGAWHSFAYHSRFSHPDRSTALFEMNRRLQQAHERMKSVRHIFITFGTAYVYVLHETGQVVANCHKVKANRFDRRRLTVDEIVARWKECIARLDECAPDARILFTVSPIRHLSDGMHDNQLSKATLLLAIDRICQQFGHCSYFPSYEIVMDDLRDYRFYESDMAHPTATAVDYIDQIFEDTYFDEETRQIARRWEKIAAALQHRPLVPQSESYRTFLSNTLQQIQELKQRYPFLDMEKEISETRSKLNTLCV